MSTNLATLMVGLGYDLSALERGAPEAFRLINSQTLGMSAEMKRASREGAEAFRTIDEMIGIHINRPMTRLLVETFPQFGKALSEVLGGVAFGAVAFAGYEVFDRIAKGVEHAQKAEQDLQESTRRVGEVFTDAMQSYEKADKLRSLSGLDKKLFEVDYSSVEEGRVKIDELAVAMEKEAKDATEAHKWTTQLLASIGDLAHTLFNTPSTLGVESIQKSFAGDQLHGIESVRQRFDELAKEDALKGTSESAKFIDDKLDTARRSLESMKAVQVNGFEGVTDQLNRYLLQIGLAKDLKGVSLGFSPEEVRAQQNVVNELARLQEEGKAWAHDQTGREDVVRQSDAFTDLQRKIELQDAYNKEVLRLTGPQYEQAHLRLLEGETAELQKHLTLLPDQAEEVKRLQAEAQKVRITIMGEEQLEALRIAQGDLEGVNQQANEFFSKWMAVNKALEDSALAGDAFRSAWGDPALSAMDAMESAAVRLKSSLTDASDRWKEFSRINGTVEGVLPPQVSPEPSDVNAITKLHQTPLGDQVGISQQQNELWQRAQQIIDSIETPLQKYNAGMEMLNELTSAGYLDAQQLAEAQTKLKEVLAESSNKIEEALRKTQDYSAGMHAFFMQLDKESQGNAQFTFQFLTNGLKSFEDELTKAVFDGKAQWKDLFRSMGEEAFKFGLNKVFANMFGLAGQTGMGGWLETTVTKLMNPGLFASPNGAEMTPSYMPGGGGAPSALPSLFTSAMGTSLTTGLQQLAKSLGQTVPSLPSLADAASSLPDAASSLPDFMNLSADAFQPFPLFASGTDSAPGGFAWVGEQGPELLNLPAGASVTPNSSLRGAGGDNHYYDMRGAVVTEDLMRKADFARAMAKARPGIVGEAMANFNEVQKRTPKR